MQKRTLIIVSKILAILAAIMLIYLCSKYLPNYLSIISSPDTFRNYVVSLQGKGVFVFILFQIVQVIVAPIPGEVIYMAGGYIYGTILGALYSTVGLLLGAIIAFYFTKFIGFSFVERLFSKEKVEKYGDLINSKKSMGLLFLIFIMPGMPKDFLIYVAGLTPIIPTKFFSVFLVGRVPWLVVSTCIGSNLQYKNYTAALIITLAACIFVVVGFCTRNKILKMMSD